MASAENTIVVNVNPGSKPGKTTISGKLDISNLLQGKCQDVLDHYEKGRKLHARNELKKLLHKYPNAKVVKQLDILILYRERKYTEAYGKIQEVLKTSSKNAALINMQGLIQRQLELFDEAIASYEKAINIKPNFADPYNNAGIIYRYYGEKEKAISCFKKALEIRPDFLSARYNLAGMKGYKFSEKEIALVEGQLQEIKAPEDKARCYFTLYNALVKNSDYQKAFSYLQRGNQILFEHNKTQHLLPAYVNKIIKGFDSQYANKLKSLNAATKRAVFIIGMPRTGSTLLEQILCAHTAITGIGESREMPRLMHEIFAQLEVNTQGFLQVYSQQDKQKLIQLAERYMQNSSKKLNGEKIFIDKMLNNFKYVGFIQNLLPNARFIYIKRHPLDTCLSCYEKKFTLGHEYSYDLLTLADHYVASTALMKHWRSLYPSIIYEINYEDIVFDTESEIKKCLAFLGLEMQASCLNFHKNVKNVFTASADQVREKINTRSIGKWKRYEEQLSPLIQRLTEAGVEINAH
jgi:tetratricopeptide (TPR) repeat protein